MTNLKHSDTHVEELHTDTKLIKRIFVQICSMTESDVWDMESKEKYKSAENLKKFLKGKVVCAFSTEYSN